MELHTVMCILSFLIINSGISDLSDYKASKYKTSKENLIPIIADVELNSFILETLEDEIAIGTLNNDIIIAINSVQESGKGRQECSTLLIYKDKQITWTLRNHT